MHSQFNWGQFTWRDRIARLQDIRIGVVLMAAILAATVLVTARAHQGPWPATSGNPTNRGERLSGVRPLHLEWRSYDLAGSSAFEEAYRDSGEPHHDRVADYSDSQSETGSPVPDRTLKRPRAR